MLTRGGWEVLRVVGGAAEGSEREGLKRLDLLGRDGCMLGLGCS